MREMLAFSILNIIYKDAINILTGIYIWVNLEYKSTDSIFTAVRIAL